MALQSSGPISLSQIQAEFGGSNPISLSEYYRNGPYTTSNNTGVPTSGTIDLGDFYGTVAANTINYEIIGGGGEGAGGYYNTGNGNAGGSSSLSSASGTSFTTITSSGGSGGIQPAPYNGSYRVSQNGFASYYGPGGQGGYNSNSDNQTAGFPAPSSSYGAGGGGGGAYPFSANNGGGGGGAATRLTGTLLLAPGSVITVTIGAGGSGNPGGGDGAKGYCQLLVNNTAYTFTSSGSFTVPA